MIKVKCDVQIVVTGGVGSGKTELTLRILKAIKSDHGLQSICKIHPSRCFEVIHAEHTGLSFEGELLQNPEAKKPFEQGQEVRHGIFAFQFPNGTNVYAWKPDGIDMFKGSSYSVNAAMKEQKVYNETKGPYADKETEPESITVRIDGISGVLYEYKAGHAMSEKCRVITLLAARQPSEASDPVGMGQCEPQQATSVGSGSNTVDGRAFMRPAIHKVHELSKNGVVFHSNQGKWSCAPNELIQVILNNGSVYEVEPTVISWVPSTKSNAVAFWRPYGSPTKIAPKPDAHKYPKAGATLESLIQSFADQFKEHSLVKGSVLKGEFWVIFNDGALVPLKDFIYYDNGSDEQIPVYYAER